MKPFANHLVSFFIVLAVVFMGAVYLMKQVKDNGSNDISSFDECVSAGYASTDSFPRKCEIPDGSVFEEVINDKAELIRVSNIATGQGISSPLEIYGEARGFWYFEASFPIRLLDENGKEIAVTNAEARGEWMTEEFVPFSAVLEFENPETNLGTLVLKRDNPSDLSENEDGISIPVIFEKPTVRNNCVITGCSSQICSDSEGITTCEYSPRYGCYKTAICERQENGECGWTETDELIQCLSSAQ